MRFSLFAGASAILCILKAAEAFQQSRFFIGTSRVQFSNDAAERNAVHEDVSEDAVWDSMRKDAQLEASREPLLASFMHATILSHSSLERALAFHIANLLSSPAMISTQIQALILEVSSWFSQS